MFKKNGRTHDDRWETQLRKGCLDLAILAILWNRRCYGLEIIRMLSNTAGVEIAEGTLYPILMRLAEESLLVAEWVAPDSGHPRKYYSLSAAGKRRAREMAKSWDEFAGTMSGLVEPLRRVSA